MNIIHVPRRFVKHEWGGTETVVLETCRALAALGHESTIWCPEALATTREEEISGVEVRRFPYFYPYLGLKRGAREKLDKKGGNLFSFALQRALRRHPELDLVHLHTQKRLGGIVRKVCRERGIPYVISLHGGLLDMPASEEASFLEPTKGAFEWGKLLGLWVGSRRVIDDAAAIICLGKEEHARILRAYPKKRVFHLPNGVEPDRFSQGDGARFRSAHSIPADAKVVVTVGRIDPQKNQLLAVRELPALLEKVPDAHLVFVGPVTNADYAQRVNEESAARGVSERVHVIPGLQADSEELLDAYHGADVFLLPSIHEPFGIVVLEAWSAGLPVVASAVGGIPSFVEDGVDGLLFQPDRPAEMVDRLHRALSDAGRAARLAQIGQEKASRHFSWTSVTERLLEIYREVREDATPVPQ